MAEEYSARPIITRTGGGAGLNAIYGEALLAASERRKEAREAAMENLAQQKLASESEREDFRERMRLQSEDRKQRHDDFMERSNQELRALQEAHQQEMDRHNLEMEKARMDMEKLKMAQDERTVNKELARQGAISAIESLDASSPKFPQLLNEVKKSPEFRQAMQYSGAGDIAKQLQDSIANHKAFVKEYTDRARNSGVQNPDYYKLPTDEFGNIDEDKVESEILQPARAAMPSIREAAMGKLKEQAQQLNAPQYTTLPWGERLKADPIPPEEPSDPSIIDRIRGFVSPKTQPSIIQQAPQSDERPPLDSFNKQQ